MRLRSIRGRLMLWGAALVALALVVAWAAISALLTDFVESRLKAELAAAARAVMAGAEWDETGRLTVAPEPADARFEAPRSGWFWQVAETQGGAVLARAPSLLGGDLGPGGRTGPNGAALMAHAEGFTAPGDSRHLTVTVTLPRAEAEAAVARIRRPLTAALVILGAALLAAQWVAVQAGLAELSRFARAIAALQDGRARALPPTRMAELAPLAEELARLIAAQAEQAARAKAQAADLAHALKTPLAVLANRAGPEDAVLIARMDAMIRWHLRRARAAGAGLNPAARAAVAPVLEDIALVLGPEAGRRGLQLVTEAHGTPDFRGAAEDLAEILGALAENAVTWATACVRLTARGEGGRLIVEIADDGPGIPEPERDRLMQHGARLDEAGPGHGLGLAIAADHARAYGSTLALDIAPEGGLLARVTLPATG